MFFKGQTEQVKEDFREKATLITFLSKDGGGENCHVGAVKMMNRVVMNWFQDVISK
jgi:hypothetical protein